MNIEKLEDNLQTLVANLAEETFIYDLLLAYNLPKASITRLKKGDYNLSKKAGEILWKKKLFFKKETERDLHGLIDELKKDPDITRHHPRFILVTDFSTLLALDTKTEDTLDIPIKDLAKHKFLFKGEISHTTKNINPYLAKGENLVVKKRRAPLTAIPIMCYGNKAADGGNLSLTEHEHDSLLTTTPEAEIFIKKFTGSAEFINSKRRYCLWIENDTVKKAQSLVEINTRIEKVRQFRLNSKKKATQEKAVTPHRFAEARYGATNSIIVPSVSSERRRYIPIGFLDSDYVISNSAFAIYDPPAYIFAIISSRIHMTWVRAVAGRLKTDYRYSSALCYNTFPFPDISGAQKTILEDQVFQVLDRRELYPEKTMAQLYDPDKMPDGLRLAHHEMDMAVEKCYRSRPFRDDEERLEYLFNLYEKMIEEEKKK